MQAMESFMMVAILVEKEVDGVEWEWKGTEIGRVRFSFTLGFLVSDILLSVLLFDATMIVF